MNQFEIPYNFDKKLIKYLKTMNIDEFIHCIYLPPYQEDYIAAKHFYMASDVKHDIPSKLPTERTDYESHVKNINDAFPNKMMLLLQQNSRLMEDNLLDYYHYDLGFNKFCVGSYEQAKVLREKYPDCEIIGSITLKIMPKDLENSKYEIFDKFVLWFPYNRNLPQIKLLPKKYEYILLVNCDCSIYCEGTHHWLAQTLEEERRTRCPKERSSVEYEDIILVRPRDLIVFEPYISCFKLQGREYETTAIIWDVKNYINQYKQYKKLNNIKLNEDLYYNPVTDKKFLREE